MDYTLILLYLFGGVTAVQLLYYLLFLRFSFAKRAVFPSSSEPVSVIVVGRNEAENFKEHLPLLCQQDYPNFEVVAVNDQSVDESKDVIEALMEEYSNLRLVNVAENDRFWLGKKYGLTLGIKGAAYENLLLIDADCKPVGKHWVSEIAKAFTTDKELFLGFGAYELKPTLLNLFIQYETIQTALQYFSFAKWGMPYMGVGRNIAYTRDLFFKNRGFVEHMHIPSGDDDLFVQQAARSKNTLTVFHKDSHTVSKAKTSWKEWISQKQRHFKTSKHYKFEHKLTLGLFSLSQMLFYILFVLALVLTPYKIEALCIFGIRFVMQYAVYIPTVLKLGSARILWLLPLLEVFVWNFQVLTLAGSRLNKKKKW